jgi:hypothetical protein
MGSEFTSQFKEVRITVHVPVRQPTSPSKFPANHHQYQQPEHIIEEYVTSSVIEAASRTKSWSTSWKCMSWRGDVWNQ